MEKFIRRWCTTDQLTGTPQADLQGDLQDDLGAPERTRLSEIDSETSGHSKPPEADGSGSVHIEPAIAEGSLAKSAFPTEAGERQKLREKAAREAGVKLEVKKQCKHVGEHCDDCGDDISSLHQELGVYICEECTFAENAQWDEPHAPP